MNLVDGVGLPRWAWILVIVLAVLIAGLTNDWALVPR